MNDYMQVRFDVEPCSEMATDVLAAVLAEIGYESFVPETRLKEELSQYPIGGVSVTYEATFVAGRDWNEEWEKNYFKPIVVGDECVIHSTFHTDIPQARYDVLIDPKMAFGTGHHETTTLMLQAILASDLTGRSVLDMGCGTACMKRGSRIFMSGFYVEDIPFIRAEAEHLGLRFVGYAEKNRWVAVECMSD